MSLIETARATGSIKINVSEIAQLGEEWDSSTLTTVAASLSKSSDTANVGNLVGNRMFFANDYMVSRFHISASYKTYYMQPPSPGAAWSWIRHYSQDVLSQDEKHRMH